MKIFSTLFITLLFSINISFAQPKYIIYMIGDGMGINHVNLADIFEAECKNEIGYTPGILSLFPYVALASTNSATNGVTDSSAGGTALATGKKTKNGVTGVDTSGNVPLRSIAYAAKDKGFKVGITTSVSVDHATPSAFYAHQPSRNHYYEIASEIITSNFDFFAGSGFLKPNTTFDKKEATDIHTAIEKGGYKIIRGKKALDIKKFDGKKTVWINDSKEDSSSLKFAIDQESSDMSLEDITRGAIQALSKNNKKGFFLMIEGGKIDWSSHSNDGATTLREMQDFNKSIAAAYEFYKQHPKETLIVVTADHETGGLGIGGGSYTLNTKILQHQKVSQGVLSSLIGNLRKENPNATFDDVKAVISANTGLWTEIKISGDDEKRIEGAYKKSFINHENETTKTLYANDDKIASLSIAILNKLATLTWGTTSHSAAYVPVYAIGEGAELFNSKMDNTDIPKKIAQAAKLEL